MVYRKRMKHWRAALVALIVVGLLMSLPYGATWYVRRYLHEHYPWMQPEAVRVVSHSEIVLEGVTFDRGWVKGRLDHVSVEVPSKIVRVQGGTVSADLDARKQGTGESSTVNLTASGLTVTLTKGSSSAKLTGVTWDGVQATFSSGTGSFSVQGHNFQGSVTKGGYDRATKHFSLQSLTTHVKDLPTIPGLALQETDLTLTDIEVKRDVLDTWDVYVSKAEAGPLTLEGVHWTPTSFLASSLTLRHPWLDATATKVVGVQVYLDQQSTTKGSIVVDARYPKKVTLRFDASQKTLSGSAACADWVNALPDTFRQGPIPTLQYTGDLSFSLDVKSTPKLTLDARCKVECKSFPDLRKEVRYMAYKADGTLFERTVQRGSSEWLPLALTGRMPQAVLFMEDRAFPWHKGYLTEAFQNSLLENVQKGKFARGGSTITQQTAKNLWLKRDKTFSRKVAELLLAQALESCLTKDEILETYLNIVEFGPDVYGIGRGSQHWFQKTPDRLDPDEAFWLASILPAPKKAKPPTDADFARIEKRVESLAQEGNLPGFVGNLDGIDATDWVANP